MDNTSDISKRKDDHIRAALELAASPRRNSFDAYRPLHNAIPEINLDDVKTECRFLGRKIAAPLMIASITGGTEEGASVNRNLAAAAHEMRVPLALGSAKIALKNTAALESFNVRDMCPDVPLLANMGLVDLGAEFGVEDCARLVESLRADGLIFHINPLHEALQAGGNTSFRGAVEKLRRAVKSLPFPVIVKEVGHGISADAFALLDTCGVKAIDVAGEGGTSWGFVEAARADEPWRREACRTFSEWGIPAARILEDMRGVRRRAKLIASGGVRNGLDAFKALCLGADMAAAALPFLAPALESPEAAATKVKQFIFELRAAMFATACRGLDALSPELLINESEV